MVRPFIPFPYVCSENVLDYKFAVSCYTSTLLNEEPVRIECGNTIEFRPLGLTILACMIHNLHLIGRDIFFTPPANQGALQYLTDQGFFEEFHFDGPRKTLRRRHTSKSVMLRRLDAFEGSYPMEIADWLTRNSMIPATAIRDMVGITLPEIIYNVFDHSKSSVGCCVCAQAYQSKKRLMFSVSDHGVGFHQTLSPRYPEAQSEASAIALAVKPGVTSKARRNNAGAGLYILSDWLKQHQGELEIISRDGRWKQLSSGDTIEETLPFTFPGSSINLSVGMEVLYRTPSDEEARPYD